MAIAGIKGISFDELGEATVTNTKRALGIR
jgi:Tat protein secretion system quality control protein TatD with DNase activity